MSNPWGPPGAVIDRGLNAGYRRGRNRMEIIKLHATAGTNSYGVCRNQGLCQWLVPLEGAPWQFAEADSLCFDSGPFNDDGPGVEIERPVTGGEVRPGLSEFRPMSASQVEWTGKIIHWLADEWDVPLAFYQGPRFQSAGFRGSVNHGDLDDQRTDGLTLEEWQAVIGVPPPPTGPKRGRSVIYDETRENGSHGYWQEGLGGLVPLPERVAAAHIYSGDLLVPVNSLDIITLAIARDKQAGRWLDSKIEPA